jgi:hypothetical protein
MRVMGHVPPPSTALHRSRSGPLIDSGGPGALTLTSVHGGGQAGGGKWIDGGSFVGVIPLASISDYAVRMKAPRFTCSSARSLIACGPVITPNHEVESSSFTAVIFTPPKIDIFQTDI